MWIAQSRGDRHCRRRRRRRLSFRDRRNLDLIGGKNATATVSLRPFSRYYIK